MADTREELVQLFIDTAYMGYEESADYFIANGVTVADKLSPTEPLTNCQQWIPVTERLPEMYWVKYEDVVESTGYGRCLVSDNVLVYCSSENRIYVAECARSDEGSPLYWCEVNSDMSIHPTHWMPLPEPPKGE